MSVFCDDKPCRRVLILGGGFGGVYAAMRLEKLARRDDVQVTLVARENFLLFTPMLHEVAASDVELSNIVSPIRKLLRRVHFFQGVVDHIDLEQKTVRVWHGTEGLGFDDHAHDLKYDHLVLGFGSVTSFYGLPGVAERCLTMRTLDDAIRLRGRLIAALEQADTECGAPLRDRLLTVCVVGGGFAGVETVGAVNDFLHAALRHYRNVKRENLRVVLVHPGQTLLPELGDRLGDYAGRKLAAAGVEVRTGARVTGMDDAGVRLKDGTTIASDTVVWTAGSTAHPLVDALDVPKIRGRIAVNEHLLAFGRPDVWALGDCASIPDLAAPGEFHPPTAQHAIREAKTLARNITASLDGRPLRAFKFKTLGMLAAIGRRRGVACVMGFRFSGFVAWWMWRTIYLSKLPRLDKKVRVALDWTLDLFFSKDIVQYLSAPAHVRPSASDVPADVIRGPVTAGPLAGVLTGEH